MTYPPDTLAAFIAYLRASPDVAAAAGSRVSGALQDAWPMPTQAVLVRSAGGSDDWQVDHLLPRLDVRCYGADMRLANDLWRRVHGWLCPTRQDGRSTAFQAAGALILDVAFEGGPNSLVEQETGWPVTVGSYRPRVRAIPLVAA